MCFSTRRWRRRPRWRRIQAFSVHIHIDLTVVDVCALFHDRVFHYPLRISFYSLTPPNPRSKCTDFCINECIKDYRHDTIIALARVRIYTRRRRQRGSLVHHLRARAYIFADLIFYFYNGEYPGGNGEARVDFNEIKREKRASIV